MHERALEAATDEPGVEGVMAVLHQDGPLRKAQKCSPRVPELGRVDGDLLPRHRLDGAARLEENRFLCPAQFGISRGPLTRRHVLTNASAPGPAPSGRTRSRPK